MGPAKLVVILAAALALPTAAAAAGWPKPRKDETAILPADEALQLQPAVWDGSRLVIGIDAAAGCYLYRDKLQVEVLEPAGYALGPMQLPAGEAHRDAHFGEVRILRGSVQAQFTPAVKTPPRRLRLRYQGCAENLVCYPPQTREVDVLQVQP